MIDNISRNNTSHQSGLLLGAILIRKAEAAAARSNAITEAQRGHFAKTIFFHNLADRHESIAECYMIKIRKNKG